MDITLGLLITHTPSKAPAKFATSFDHAIFLDLCLSIMKFHIS